MRLSTRIVLSVMVALLPCAGLLSAAEEGLDAGRVQASIDGGLAWLAENQVTEGPLAGSWEATRYRSAAASLAGLAMLANGHRPGEGEYGRVIDRAMTYVKGTMTADGYLGAADQQMYVHAIATLFGLSYLGTCEEPEAEKELAEWCRQSIALIERAQRVRKSDLDRGGWRYDPGTTASDLSVTSWMLLVLHTARQCGYAVDAKTVDAGLAYVNRAYQERSEIIRDAEGRAVATRERKGYLYRHGTSIEPEKGATGAALFIKSLLEGGLDVRSRTVLPFLTEAPPGWDGEWHNGYFFFAAFYLTQGMFQIGGDDWQAFRGRIGTELVAHQEGDGKWPFPAGNRRQSVAAGSAYSTAMAVLILSLDKQYLPMYQRQSPLF